MPIDLRTSCTVFRSLVNHLHHEIECIEYADEKGVVCNVSLECITCGEVLLGADAPSGSLVKMVPSSRPPRKKRKR